MLAGTVCVENQHMLSTLIVVYSKQTVIASFLEKQQKQSFWLIRALFPKTMGNKDFPKNSNFITF